MGGGQQEAVSYVFLVITMTASSWTIFIPTKPEYPMWSFPAVVTACMGPCNRLF